MKENEFSDGLFVLFFVFLGNYFGIVKKGVSRQTRVCSSQHTRHRRDQPTFRKDVREVNIVLDTHPRRGNAARLSYDATDAHEQ